MSRDKKRPMFVRPLTKGLLAGINPDQLEGLRRQAQVNDTEARRAEQRAKFAASQGRIEALARELGADLRDPQDFATLEALATECA